MLDVLTSTVRLNRERLGSRTLPNSNYTGPLELPPCVPHLPKLPRHRPIRPSGPRKRETEDTIYHFDYLV